MSAPPRTLPLRVPPVPGEALDSWLEALARRHQVTVGTLVTALGWHMPGSPGGLVAGIPAQVLRRLEHQAGLPAGRLDGAVLDRYLPLAAARRRGSRYCPSCLAGPAPPTVSCYVTPARPAGRPPAAPRINETSAPVGTTMGSIEIAFTFAACSRDANARG